MLGKWGVTIGIRAGLSGQVGESCSVEYQLIYCYVSC